MTHPSAEADLSQQLERDAMALVAVVRAPPAVVGEPVDDPSLRATKGRAGTAEAAAAVEGLPAAVREGG